MANVTRAHSFMYQTQDHLLKILNNELVFGEYYYGANINCSTFNIHSQKPIDILVNNLSIDHNNIISLLGLRYIY